MAQGGIVTFAVLVALGAIAVAALWALAQALARPVRRPRPLTADDLIYGDVVWLPLERMAAAPHDRRGGCAVKDGGRNAHGTSRTHSKARK